jgi:hypothetical protein
MRHGIMLHILDCHSVVNANRTIVCAYEDTKEENRCELILVAKICIMRQQEPI